MTLPLTDDCLFPEALLRAVSAMPSRFNPIDTFLNRVSILTNGISEATLTALNETTAAAVIYNLIIKAANTRYNTNAPLMAVDPQDYEWDPLPTDYRAVFRRDFYLRM
jgi:hypothetical protein